MASTLTAVNIINQALRNLGEDAIASLSDTDRRAQIANEFWETVRDATLTEHPWNFALTRTTLRAYETPAAALTPGAVSGTGVTFLTDAAAFVAGDVGRQIRSGSARALIVSFVSPQEVVADITAVFPGTAAIVSGSWRLYHPIPEWGYQFSILVPADALRVWRLQDNVEYQVENGYILSDAETIRVRYVRQETDTTKYSFPFVQALAAHLTAVLAKPITGQLPEGDRWARLYDARLMRAKATDGQEGTPEILESNALIGVR